MRKTWSEKSHDYRDVIVFEKRRFQNVFRLHETEKPAFSNFSGLKSVFEKLRFRDGLVWMVGLAVEIKLCFQISPVQCARYLDKAYNVVRTSDITTLEGRYVVMFSV